jgi:hypothetical protein
LTSAPVTLSSIISATVLDRAGLTSPSIGSPASMARSIAGDVVE